MYICKSLNSQIIGDCADVRQEKVSSLFPRACLTPIRATYGSARARCEDRWRFISEPLRLLIWTYFPNQFSMRIIRRPSEDSRRDLPHDTSMGLACEFGYLLSILVRKILIENFPHDNSFNSLIRDMFKFHTLTDPLHIYRIRTWRLWQN